MKREIKNRYDLMGFGKYKDLTVQDVLNEDPSYFLWLDANTDIEIACHILVEADEEADEMANDPMGWMGEEW